MRFSHSHRATENVLPFFASRSSGLVKAAGWYVELVLIILISADTNMHSPHNRHYLFFFVFFYKSEALVSVVCLCGQTTLLCPAWLYRLLFFYCA